MYIDIDPQENSKFTVTELWRPRLISMTATWKRVVWQTYGRRMEVAWQVDLSI